MKEYEVMIERITPCGGRKYSRKEFVEVEVASPAQYVTEHGRFPIKEQTVTEKGDIFIVTGNEKGYIDEYLFTVI